MMNGSSAFSIIVQESESGLRLDTLIASRIAECSRSFAVSLIRKGIITVGDESKKPGYRLREGDNINGVIPSPTFPAFGAEAIPLSLIYEDADIAVIDKPPGLVVHPAPGHHSGTLVNALLYHCPDIKGIGGEMRPGIVHRLDRDTSGLLVIAKNVSSMADLSAQFQNRTVCKKYLALVHGKMRENEGIITLPIGRHPTDRKKMSVISKKGRHAETRWQVRERFPELTLLEIDLKTGRTHQIRVHCAAVRHPVVGDPVYGGGRAGKSYPASLKTLLHPLSRQMLHAKRLCFVHPGTGQKMQFESPLPEDMACLLISLRKRKSEKDGPY